MAATIAFGTVDMSVLAQQTSTAQTVTEETSGISWDGVTTQQTYEGENYKITFLLDGYWNGGYNAKVKIQNTGNIAIENWYVAFDFVNTICYLTMNTRQYGLFGMKEYNEN